MTAEKFAEMLKHHGFEGDIVITDDASFYLLKDVTVHNNIVEIRIYKDEELE